MDRNPYASPITSPSGSNGARRVPIDQVPADPEYGLVNVVEQAAQPPRAWRLALGDDEAWLFLPGEQYAFAFSHAEMAEHGNLMLWGSYVLLGMRGMLPDGRAIAFKVDGDAKNALRRWLRANQATHLTRALKKRLRFSIPLGIFLVVVGMIGTKRDVFSLTFGIGTFLLGIVGPRVGRPWVFAAEGALWLVIAAGNAVSAYHGSKVSMVFGVFCLFWARQGFRLFAFYR